MITLQSIAQHRIEGLNVAIANIQDNMRVYESAGPVAVKLAHDSVSKFRDDIAALEADYRSIRGTEYYAFDTKAEATAMCDQLRTDVVKWNYTLYPPAGETATKLSLIHI